MVTRSGSVFFASSPLCVSPLVAAEVRKHSGERPDRFNVEACHHRMACAMPLLLGHAVPHHCFPIPPGFLRVFASLREPLSIAAEVRKHSGERSD